MEEIIPLSELQHQAKKILGRTQKTGEPLIITQNGRPAAVFMSYEDYEGLKESFEEMSEPDWREKMARASKDVDAGRLFSLKEVKNKLASKKSGNRTHKRGRR